MDRTDATRRGPVDAGLDASGAAILAELKSAGAQPQQVLAVLITHGHADHYAAATLSPKAEVCGGADDIAMMTATAGTLDVGR